MSKRLKEMKELVTGLSGGRVLQQEGIACAKTLKWERVWHIQGDSKEASMAGIECTRRRVVGEKVETSWMPDHVDF